MNKDYTSPGFLSAEAKQLIDYNVFEEPRDYLWKQAPSLTGISTAWSNFFPAGPLLSWIGFTG
jgi:hypothetical protein